MDFSIIIPHHNIPALLERCLESIPLLEGVQIIVIDDKSDDEYISTLKDLETRFANATFVYSDNAGGAGKARNIGLGLATGKWVLFADADDFFADDFAAILTDFPLDENADIVFFRNKCVLSDNLQEPSTQAEYLNDIITRYFDSGDETDLRCRFFVPWGKFIRRSFIVKHSLSFDETPYSNDVCFSVAAGCLAESIRVEDTILYVYTIRSGSLCDDFSTKPGELEIRSEVMFRAQCIIHESGRKLTGRNPLSDFLSLLFHRNRSYYDRLYYRLPEAGLSPWRILRQVGAWEKYSSKIRIYLHTIPLIIRRNIHGLRHRES